VKELGNFDKKAKVEPQIERYKPIIKRLREAGRPEPPKTAMPGAGGATAPTGD